MQVCGREHRSRRLGALAGACIAASLVACGTAAPAPPPPPASLGVVQDTPVPRSILSIPLVDEAGKVVTLGSFAGRVVAIADFLTSCQEVCPITTGAFADAEHALRAAGLSSKVVLTEITVDAWRDTPARLGAYAHLAGSTWPLLTASAANLRRLWSFFHIYYQRVPEPSPPGIDWYTNKPYTFDIDHDDGFILVDAGQHERFLTISMPSLPSHTLTPALRKLLDPQGMVNLRSPSGQVWTPTDLLGAIGWLLGRPIPGA